MTVLPDSITTGIRQADFNQRKETEALNWIQISQILIIYLPNAIMPKFSALIVYSNSIKSYTKYINTTKYVSNNNMKRKYIK